MEHKLFTFWLDGFLKGVGDRALAENEVKIIRGELEKTMNPVVSVKKPDYYIGSPPFTVPMYDQYDENGKKKERLIC